MRHLTHSRGLLAAAVLLLAGSLAHGTGRNNGAAGGYADQSLVNTAVAVPLGLAIAPFRAEYHSALVAQGGAMVWDSEFADTLNTQLLLPLNAGFSALNIHMAQCFSGGFIDELDHGTSTFPGTIGRLTINTAARWDRQSFGTETGDPRNRYSHAWWFEQNNGVDNKAMLNAYSTALTSFAYSQPTRARELPQYFSAAGAQDQALLGSGPDKKVALLFVGDDRDNSPAGAVRAQRHYRDAQRMYDTLRTLFGFAAADIRVYYHDGTRPAGTPAGLPIDGAATEANFKAFFSAPPQALEGGNDEVFVWTSDHGSLKLALSGRVQLVPANAPGLQVAQLDFELGAEYLAAMNGAEAQGQLFGRPRLTVGTLDNPGGEPVLVSLNGQALGSIGAAGEALEVDPAWLLGMNALSFSSSAGSSITVGDLDLGFVAANAVEPVPEPAAWALMAAGLAVLLYRRGRPVIQLVLPPQQDDGLRQQHAGQQQRDGA